MNRWYALAIALALAARAHGQQPGDDFGTLTTAPPQATRPAPAAALPAGVTPAAPAPKQARAAPPNPFPLPADAGTWLICAAAYSGADGAELARQVCLELRQKHGLRAYIYNRGEEERRQQDEEWERTKAAHPGVPLRRKTVRIVDHFAVLVAGWADDKGASDYLPRIKKLPCPELKLDGGKSPYEIMTTYEEDPKTKQKAPKYGRVNPFHSAMITRNPLLPSAAAAKPKFDPIWEQLNEDEEYSLLKSKGKYTLMVKEYAGAREIQARSNTEKLLSAVGLGGGETLDAAGRQAHETAKALERLLKLKTFVLHMRGSSVVTVGEFTGPDDPNMQLVQRQLENFRIGRERGGNGGDPIGLMANPVAVEVPRMQ